MGKTTGEKSLDKRGLGDSITGFSRKPMLARTGNQETGD
jgi:hypothetical protein